YSFHFLFLLLRLPPTSTLFPYTTLFRSTRFNAISKNLDLLVDSTQILNISPAAPMPEISGPVQPLSSQLAEWFGNKSFGRESGAFQITFRQPDPPNVYLSGKADRHGLHFLIQHIHRHVGYWFADRNISCRQIIGGDFIDAAANHCLRRAVLVDQTSGRRMLPPGCNLRIGEGLSSN